MRIGLFTIVSLIRITNGLNSGETKYIVKNIFVYWFHVTMKHLLYTDIDSDNRFEEGCVEECMSDEACESPEELYAKYSTEDNRP